MNLKPAQFDTLAKLMDASTMRHQVIAQNIANVNTPGYRRLDVEFEDQLKERLERGQGGDVAKMTPQLVVDDTGTFRADGNNVEIDRETTRLNKNMLLHNTYVQILNMRLTQMRSAISR